MYFLRQITGRSTSSSGKFCYREVSIDLASRSSRRNVNRYLC